MGVVPVLMCEQYSTGIEAAAARFDMAKRRATTRLHRPDPRGRKAMAETLESAQRLSIKMAGDRRRRGFISSDGGESAQRNVPLNGRLAPSPHKAERNTMVRSGGGREGPRRVLLDTGDDVRREGSVEELNGGS